MAIVNELITSLGFKLDPKAIATIEAVEGAIGKIVKVADKLGKTFTVAKGLMDYFTGVAVKDAKTIRDNAKTFGISAEAYQRWGHAARVAGVSAKALYEDIKKLKLKKGFTDQGIIDWMNKLSAQGPQAALKTLEKLELSEDFLKLIKTQGGTGGVLKLLADAGPLLTNEEVENAAQFSENMNSLMSHLDMMKRKAFIQLSPEFNEQIKTIDKWLRENDYFIKEITTAGKALSKGFSNFFKIIKNIYNYIKDMLRPIFGDWAKDMDTVSVAANAITTALLIMTAAKILTGVAKLASIIKGIALFFGIGGAAAAGAGAGAGGAAAGGAVAGKVAAGSAVAGAVGLGAVLVGTNMVWTELKNIGKKTDKRELNWLEQLSNWSGLTELVANSLSEETKAQIRGTGAHTKNITYNNNIYPANNQQLEQTVQQVNGFQMGGNGFIGQPAQ